MRDREFSLGFFIFQVVAFVVVIFLLSPVLAFNNPGMYAAIGMACMACWGLCKVVDRSTTTWLVATLFCVVIAVGGPAFSTFFVSDRIALSSLPETAKINALPELDVAQVPLVSKDVALTAMRRKLGEDLGLGSQFELSEANKQILFGELVWVSPLEPRSQFKAWFGEGSPGYAVVSASDASIVRIIKAPFKVTNREWLSLSYRAWLYNPTLDIRNWTFEVNEAGEPFWIGRIVSYKVGMIGEDLDGVLVVDAVTRKITKYSVADAPAWIDQLYTAPTLIGQINVHGDLINGYINWLDEGKFRISAGLDLVLADGKLWHLGTLSSLARDEAITEAVLIDARTKETTRFTLSGITEAAAAAVLEGQNPEKELTAGNPIPYLINGVPAYVAALSDRSGVIRSYGVVALDDAQVLAVADRLSVAIQQFGNARNRNAAVLNTTAVDVVVNGKVRTIGQDAVSGTFYLLVDTPNGLELISAANHLSDELFVTMPGDPVKINAKKTAERTLLATSFDNLTF